VDGLTLLNKGFKAHSFLQESR